MVGFISGNQEVFWQIGAEYWLLQKALYGFFLPV